MMSLRKGLRIASRYQLEAAIAEGGMGEVWKALDLTLGRRVAIKTVSQRYLLTNPHAVSILTDEAKMGARLIESGSTVAILDLLQHKDENGTIHCIVMEYIEGITLQQWIQRIAPTLEPTTRYLTSVFIAWQLARTVHAAHEQEILHRDLKPLNVLLSKTGSVKIGDFGLARFIEAVTRSHTVAGIMSAHYAAPEQWRDEKHTVQTDTYQLGATLFELFSGRPPFVKSSALALMNAHLNEATPSLAALAPLLTPAIASEIGSMLEKDPDKRANLWNIIDAVAAVLFGGPIVLEVPAKDKAGADVDLNAAFAITSISAKEGPIPLTYEFPDPTEVGAEAIALSLAGVTAFTLSRAKSATTLGATNQAQPEAAAAGGAAPPKPA